MLFLNIILFGNILNNNILDEQNYLNTMGLFYDIIIKKYDNITLMGGTSFSDEEQGKYNQIISGLEKKGERTNTRAKLKD